jgi:hypothetical protein
MQLGRISCQFVPPVGSTGPGYFYNIYLMKITKMPIYEKQPNLGEKT